jgi:Membrane-bound metallopeptidase
MLKNRNTLTKIWINPLAILCLFLICIGSVHAQSRKELENQKAKIEKEIASINAILNETKNTRRMSASELQILKKKIAKRETLISNITNQMNLLNGEIVSTQQSINSLGGEISSLKASYSKMLRYAQRNRTATDKLLFIFSAKNYNEAYRRYVFFKQYGDMQKNMLKNIRNKSSELEKRTGELSLKKQNQASLLQQEQTNKQSLTEEQQQKQQALSQLQVKEKQLTSQIRAKQALRRKLQNQINAAIAAEVRKQTQIAAKRQAQKKKQIALATKPKQTTNKKEKTEEEKPAQTQKTYLLSATPEEEQLSNSFAANQGHLPWPCESGAITSSFGTHSHPEIKGIMIENNGIDIRTSRGGSVRAVFSGVVSKIFSGPNGGKIVILRHGEYLTVYTNLGSVNVSNGQKVSTKQRIGSAMVNSDGVSEINFQIWKGNNKLNPASWIKR